MDIVASIIKALFGSKADKDRKQIEPYLEKIKAVYPSIEKLTNDELRAHSEALKKQIADFIAADEARIVELKAILEKPETQLEEKEKISKEIDETTKRIGAFKANIIGINLVAVLQFAYGSYTGSERLRDSALTLLERLPAEDNRYMRAWQAAGVRPRNAFESQALLQLATEYCAARRCAECPVGRRIAKSLAEAGEERTNR